MGASHHIAAPLAPGKDFHESQLPSGLRSVVEKLQSLPGYPLGPIRDVTVNIRSSDDYQTPDRGDSWTVPRCELRIANVALA